MLKFIMQLVVRHEEALALFALAVVVTMRDELPPPFNRMVWLAWGYGWLHDALKAFVSFGRPGTVKELPTVTTTVQRTTPVKPEGTIVTTVEETHTEELPKP